MNKEKERLEAELKEKLSNLITVGIWGTVFFIIIIMMTCCAHWRLPDRTKCTTRWVDRKDCISDRECGYDQLCAKRGYTIGKCTLIDCCDPWRGQPGIKSGYDWCTQTELDNDTETRYIY